jgi:hypothetical protein
LLVGLLADEGEGSREPLPPDSLVATACELPPELTQAVANAARDAVLVAGAAAEDAAPPPVDAAPCEGSNGTMWRLCPTPGDSARKCDPD